MPRYACCGGHTSRSEFVMPDCTSRMLREDCALLKLNFRRSLLPRCLQLLPHPFCHRHVCRRRRAVRLSGDNGGALVCRLPDGNVKRDLLSSGRSGGTRGDHYVRVLNVHFRQQQTGLAGAAAHPLALTRRAIGRQTFGRAARHCTHCSRSGFTHTPHRTSQQAAFAPIPPCVCSPHCHSKHTDTTTLTPLHHHRSQPIPHHQHPPSPEAPCPCQQPPAPPRRCQRGGSRGRSCRR